MSPITGIEAATKAQIDLAFQRSRRPVDRIKHETEMSRVADQIAERLNAGEQGAVVVFEGPNANAEASIASNNLRSDLKNRGLGKLIVAVDHSSDEDIPKSMVIFTRQTIESDPKENHTFFKRITSRLHLKTPHSNPGR